MAVPRCLSRGADAAPARGSGSCSPCCWPRSFSFWSKDSAARSNYFDTVNQAFAHRSTSGTRTFNLEGDVVPGSIHATAVGTDFAIAQGSHTVAVTNTGSPPQLFQANIAVVVVGHFTSEVSTQLRVPPDLGEAFGELPAPLIRTG